MPAEYLINRNLGVVFSQAWGVLTDADLLEHQRRLGQDQRFEPSLNQIFNFEDVTDVEVTPMGIRTLAERTLFGEGARRAFVVHPGALKMFGLMRMFEALTSEHPDKLRVQFDHVQKALQWIGTPSDAVGAAG
jgi:hypothetical protein